MTATEFKRELSKLSGVDFFNPKYRELFKKTFPEEKAAEEEKPKDTEGEAAEEKTEAPEEVSEREAPESETDVGKAEDEREEADEPEGDKTEVPENREQQSEVREEPHGTERDVETLKEDKGTDELLEAKIENLLLRGGVREEKLGAAMRLARAEIHGIHELDRVQDILRDFPEWLRGYKPVGFGMDVDNGSDNLTEEEKRLKAMGINPRE